MHAYLSGKPLVRPTVPCQAVWNQRTVDRCSRNCHSRFMFRVVGRAMSMLISRDNPPCSQFLYTFSDLVSWWGKGLKFSEASNMTDGIAADKRLFEISPQYLQITALDRQSSQNEAPKKPNPLSLKPFFVSAHVFPRSSVPYHYAPTKVYEIMTSILSTLRMHLRTRLISVLLT